VQNLPYSKQTRLSRAKAREFALVTGPFVGYRNREDTTLLPANVLVKGSVNVLTNTSGRIGARKGYILDGAADTTLAPILSSFDWQSHTGAISNLRAGFLTSAGNDGKLQYRYVDTVGSVSWRDLLIGLDSVKFNFCDYWDNSHMQALLLFVNGDACIWEWNGGVTTVDSSTAVTITKQGSTSWAEEGFYTTGSHTVSIAGLQFMATGGWATTTLTGVSPDPTSVALLGAIVNQTPEKTAQASLTGLALTGNDLISNLKNQIYVGQLTNRGVYVSKTNDYKNYGFTAPTRVVGEGAILTLDGNPTALYPQEDQMYISAGLDQWYQTQFTLSSDLTKEDLTISRLKTASQQATQSQGLTSKYKNNLVFLSFEPVINSLGRVADVLADPNIVDISFPIVNDMNDLDFTDGQIQYHRNFIYVTAPKSSTVLIYNMTNPKDMYWEAPQRLPVGRLSIINDELYGHSYLTSETYKLFTGSNDNGNFISTNAVFAFNNFGSRFTTKGFNQYYFDGYISGNTTLTMGFQFDLDGCARTTAFDIHGTDSKFVCQFKNDANLGKVPLGKNPLGSSSTPYPTFPPWFRGIKTFPLIPFFEYQVSFSSNGVDQQWELTSFGPAYFETSEGQNNIKD
jgi:hypothetical protein